MTKIHHLNCGTMRPLVPRGTQGLLSCLRVETNQDLLLVDTGFGTTDYLCPTAFVRLFTRFLGMPRDLEETAACRVERLGYARTGVRYFRGLEAL